MTRRWFSLAAVMLASAASALSAAELTTDAERSYRELRKSNDAKTRLMAERWYGAIRLQEWTNASGKFSTTAKYVEHDPALAWVKLRVIQGTGAERVVKDVTIPLEKLSKTCQVRVRQIDLLADKVAEAAAAEAESEENAEGGGGEMADGRAMASDPRGGRGGEYGAGLEGMDAGQVQAEATDPRYAGVASDPRQMSDPRAGVQSQGPEVTTQTASPAISSGGLPAMLPPLPSDRPQAAVAVAETADPRYGAQYAAAAPAEPAAPVQPAAPPNFPDNDPWRHDYEAFRANFIHNREGVLTAIEQWLGVVQMQEHSARAKVSYEQLVGRAGGMTPTSFLPMSELEQVGEFEWEATVAQPPGGEVAWTDVLSLPPLPDPLKIELRLDEERGAGAWQQLKVGDRVRFVGRLIGFAGHNVWVAAIRFPAEQQLAAEQPPAEQAPAEEQPVDPSYGREAAYGEPPAENPPTDPRDR